MALCAHCCFCSAPPAGGNLAASCSLEPGRTLSLPLLHDTGFFLKDPYSGAQAVLVEYAPCAGQLPPDLRACLEGCFYQEQWPEPPPGRAIRILECRTASGRRLLPALCVKDAALSRQHQTIRPGELTIVFSPEHSMGEDSAACLAQIF